MVEGAVATEEEVVVALVEEEEVSVVEVLGGDGEDHTAENTKMGLVEFADCLKCLVAWSFQDLHVSSAPV